MSLRHMVMISFGPDVTEEQVAALAAGLDGLPGQIAQVREYEHGPNIGIRASAWDYGITARFDNADDFRIYADHPAHVAVVRDLLGPIAHERHTIQFQT